MTANLLTLNSSKTEFLLIGLKNNLPKYTTLHLTPPTLLETLALSLTNIFLSLTKLHFSPKANCSPSILSSLFALYNMWTTLYMDSRENWELAFDIPIPSYSRSQTALQTDVGAYYIIGLQIEQLLTKCVLVITALSIINAINSAILNNSHQNYLFFFKNQVSITITYFCRLLYRKKIMSCCVQYA